MSTSPVERWLGCSEEILDLGSYNLVQPFVRLSEQADAQRIQNSNTEQVQMETRHSGGIFPGDHDMDARTSANATILKTVWLDHIKGGQDRQREI